mmetsp:Transcript_23113/g.56996  ORF Transcript_23113/g.56996 Transcript_23113/m.56996 type:complete len:241 (+) Transcript_23113:233-955(+)
MRDDESRTAMLLDKSVDRHLHQGLALAVQSRGSFIENQESWPLHQRPCDGDALLLPPAQPHPPLAHHGLKPVGEARNEFPGVGALGGLLHLCCSWLVVEREAVCDVLFDRGGEEDGLLHHRRDVAHVRGPVEAGELHAIDQDFALHRIVEALDQLHDRALPPPRWANDGDGLASINPQGHVLQHALIAPRRVRKSHPHKVDGTLHICHDCVPPLYRHNSLPVQQLEHALTRPDALHEIVV